MWSAGLWWRCIKTIWTIEQDDCYWQRGRLKISDDLDRCWISAPIYACYTPTDVLKKAFSGIGVCAFNVYIDGIGIFAGDKLYWLWHTAEQHSIMIGIARLLKIVIIKSSFKLLSLRIMPILFSDAVLFGFPNLETKNFVIKWKLCSNICWWLKFYLLGR